MYDLAPLIRIILRYAVGAGVMGSTQIGNQLAADPDLVAVICLMIGGAVESFYILARKKGWSK